MMDINKITLFSNINVFIFLTIPFLLSAQSPPAPFSLSPSPSPLESPSPAPSPALRHANLTDLLTHAGPYRTFLSYLIQTNVIEVFQSQANDTKSGGLTLFAPEDSAFARLKESTFANLTNDQLKTFLLCHAFPHYYTLANFQNLSTQNPVTTFAGGSCTLNVTYDMGIIHIVSDWFSAKIISSTYSTSPVALYALDMVLVSKEIFSVEPALAPVSAPPPEAKPADAAPSSSVTGTSPTSSKSDSTAPSSSNGVRVGLLEFLALVFTGFLVIFW